MLIFIINSAGVPARNSFVQNERRQVCNVTHSYLGLISTMSLFPFLWGDFMGSEIPASLPILCAG